MFKGLSPGVTVSHDRGEMFMGIRIVNDSSLVPLRPTGDCTRREIRSTLGTLSSLGASPWPTVLRVNQVIHSPVQPDISEGAGSFPSC